MNNNNLLNRKYELFEDTKQTLVVLAATGTIIILDNTDIGREIICSGLEQIKYYSTSISEKFDQLFDWRSYF